MAQSRFAPKVQVKRERCPYCHDHIPYGEAPAVCRACHALHHSDCFQTHGACATCATPLNIKTTTIPRALESQIQPQNTSLSQARWPYLVVLWGGFTLFGAFASLDAPTWKISLGITIFLSIVGLLLASLAITIRPKITAHYSESPT